MGSYQSSFHPVFWLHHCNVDRIYEKYLELEPDSATEFERNQKRHDPDGKTGFPDGPFGRYLPFVNHRTGESFHASEMFDTESLGFRYDALPPAPSLNQQMREPPFYAIFRGVDVKEMVQARLLFVYVCRKNASESDGGKAGGDDEGKGSDGDGGEIWSPPQDTSREALLEHPGFAGIGSIFFLAIPGGCENCLTRPAFDVNVDITAALRASRIHPRDALIEVMVENEDDSATFLLSAATDCPIPTPELCGPSFRSFADIGAGADVDNDDVTMAQTLLVRTGIKANGVVDGMNGANTKEAIKAFQRAVGLKVDGVVGARTKQMMTTGFLNDTDEHEEHKFEVAGGLVFPAELTWRLADDTVPGYLLNKRDEVVADMAAALKGWTDQFSAVAKLVDSSDNTALITFSWDDRTKVNDFAFDGPGGALGHATCIHGAAGSNKAATVTFDSAERWELSAGSGSAHHRKGAADAAADDGDAFWVSDGVSMRRRGKESTGCVCGCICTYYYSPALTLTHPHSLHRTRAVFISCFQWPFMRSATRSALNTRRHPRM